MTDLIILGLSHKTAPLEIREKFDLSNLSPSEYLTNLSRQGPIQSGMVLSTCNRVEIYATGEGSKNLFEAVWRFLKSLCEVDSAKVEQFFYSRLNREAVRHLFRVASSLDSMVVGEPQILGQVKEAYFSASASRLNNPFLDLLLQKTLFVAKRVRSETAIASQAVSVSFLAVELAKKIFGSLEGKTVLIMGAGEMAELAAQHLQKQKLKEIYFANRSYEHSVALAQEFTGIPIQMEHFPRYMKQADIVIVSTAAPHYLIQKEQVDEIMAERKQAPMFFIDISVPRNVDPNINQNENVYLFNIDDLAQIVQSNVKSREEEAVKAEAIVEREVEQFYRSLEKRAASPVIQSLQSKYDSLRKDELKRLIGRLNGITGIPGITGISENHLKEIDLFSETLLRKILNDPILFLKDQVADDPEKAEMFQRIFSLRKEKEK